MSNTEDRRPFWRHRFESIDVDGNKVLDVYYADGHPFTYKYKAINGPGTGICVDPTKLIAKPNQRSVYDEESIL